MRAIPKHIAETSATTMGTEGEPFKISGMTATHETYTKPPAVAASRDVSTPPRLDASNPIAVPKKAAVAVANWAPIACHLLRSGRRNVHTRNRSGRKGGGMWVRLSR